MSLSSGLTGFAGFAHTRIFGNKANEGVVAFITGVTNEIPTLVTMNGVFIYNNGNFGLNGFSDFNIFSLSNNAEIRMYYVTIADNDIKVDGEILRSVGSSFFLENSIIHNNEKVFTQFLTNQSRLYCLIVNEDNSFTGTNIFVETPGFVNSSINDYHLSSASFATDLCDNGFAPFSLDAEYDPRGIDILNVINIGGPYDAGADEYNDHEAVFKSGFIWFQK